MNYDEKEDAAKKDRDDAVHDFNLGVAGIQTGGLDNQEGLRSYKSPETRPSELVSGKANSSRRASEKCADSSPKADRNKNSESFKALGLNKGEKEAIGAVSLLLAIAGGYFLFLGVSSEGAELGVMVVSVALFSMVVYAVSFVIITILYVAFKVSVILVWYGIMTIGAVWIIYSVGLYLELWGAV
ncbi:hypothetical protein [Pseudohongiella acticola]|jgi:hypothetical protein|uniref:hypothetical protein n=1 Tax=Pseudohongiella acticola TaxID=1524254 RepID=UPI0030ECABF8